MATQIIIAQKGPLPIKVSIYRSKRWSIRSDGRWIGVDTKHQYYDRHPGQSGRKPRGSRPNLCQSRQHSHECGSRDFSRKAHAGDPLLATRPCDPNDRE